MRFSSTFFACSAALALSACAPKYPNCETDDHCKTDGHNEVCVNKTCQECRDDTQCTPRGENYACNAGRCELKPECTADADCTKVGQGLVCRSQKCVPECNATEDCPSGKKCEAQKCVAECTQDVDCGPNRICNNGVCEDKPTDGGTKVSANCRPMTAAPGVVIATPRVAFDFDKYDLTVDARSSLDQTAQCLKEAPGVQVVIEGHADDRGTQEYNLALGEKRAATVRGYLKNMGIDTSRMQTRSKGENEPICNDQSESCWSQNRRVEFIQNQR